MAVAGLFPYYQSGSSSFALATYYRNTWSVLLGAVVDVVAGTCLIIPATRRLIGPGILLGNVAVSSGGLVYLIIFGLKYSDLAGGFWLELAAGLAEVTAACLAGIAVARTGEVGFSRWSGRSTLSWVIVLISATAAVAMLLHSINLVTQSQPGEYLAWSIWMAVMVLAVPVFAMVVTPARFAVAILFGWLAADVAFFAYHYFSLDSPAHQRLHTAQYCPAHRLRGRGSRADCHRHIVRPRGAQHRSPRTSMISRVLRAGGATGFGVVTGCFVSLKRASAP